MHALTACRAKTNMTSQKSAIASKEQKLELKNKWKSNPKTEKLLRKTLTTLATSAADLRTTDPKVVKTDLVKQLMSKLLGAENDTKFAAFIAKKYKNLTPAAKKAGLAEDELKESIFTSIANAAVDWEQKKSGISNSTVRAPKRSTKDVSNIQSDSDSEAPNWLQNSAPKKQKLSFGTPPRATSNSVTAQSESETENEDPETEFGENDSVASMSEDGSTALAYLNKRYKWGMSSLSADKLSLSRWVGDARLETEVKKMLKVMRLPEKAWDEIKSTIAEILDLNVHLEEWIKWVAELAKEYPDSNSSGVNQQPESDAETEEAEPVRKNSTQDDGDLSVASIDGFSTPRTSYQLTESQIRWVAEAIDFKLKTSGPTLADVLTWWGGLQRSKNDPMSVKFAAFIETKSRAFYRTVESLVAELTEHYGTVPVKTFKQSNRTQDRMTGYQFNQNTPHIDRLQGWQKWFQRRSAESTQEKAQDDHFSRMFQSMGIHN